jgi:uncharacterized membrane protein
MLLATVAPLAQATGARSNGVDLSVEGVSFTYSTATDEGKYRMFSSNHPIPGFNRPASLFVIDGMVDVPIDVEVTIRNTGTLASAVTDIRLLVLHDEYQRFEITNMTGPLNSVSASSSGAIQFQFTPTYAGNHSLQIEVLSATPDNNPSNDLWNDRITIGAFYWNCDTLQNWTATGEWSLNTDTSVSLGSSCHAGNGEFSSYSANTISRLTTPTLDLADGLKSGTRTMGLSFFYTGSVLSPDRLSIEARTSTGVWEELTGFSGTVDQDFFTDGVSWQTFSIASGGHTTPLIPITPSRHLHANSAIRWTLTSDSSNEDIGIWMDELVMVYDQAARAESYGVVVQGQGTTGAAPGSWGNVDLKVVNDGEISTNIVPRIEGLPQDWDTYTTFIDGSSVPSTGFNLLPGTSRDISVRLKPDPNSSVGLVPMTFNASTDHSDVYAVSPMSFTVLADRIPVLKEPEARPSCPAQQSCPFSVELSNLGGASDVFDLNVDESALPAGWSVDFAWSQATSVLVRPGETEVLNLVLTVPQGAQPDTVRSVTMTAVAQNDTSRTSTIDVDVGASMVSDLQFSITSPFEPLTGGEVSSMSVEIRNLADRPDILALEAVLEDENQGWLVEFISQDQAVMTAGSTVSITIRLKAPEGLLASDISPNVRLSVASERSGMSLQSDWWSGPDVVEVRELAMSTNVTMLRLMPGVPTAMNMTMDNTGNSDLTLSLQVDGVPNGWTTWWRSSDENISSSIDMPIDTQDSANEGLQLMFLVPTTAQAGVPVDLGLRVLDGDVALAQHGFQVLIEPVRKPGLTLETDMTAVRAGSSVTVNGSVVNMGNAPDPTVFIEVSVRSTQDMSDMITFLSLEGGGGLSLDTPHIIGLGTGSVRPFQLDVAVPSSAPLGTRIVVDVTVQGGLDDEGRPYTITKSHLIEVDQRRDVQTSWNTPESVADYGGNHQTSLDFVSSSSFAENLSVVFDHPEGWAVVCDGFGALSSGSVANIELEPGHIVTVERSLGCTILQNKGASTGDLTLTVQTSDDVVVTSTTRSLAWYAPPEDEGLNGQVIALGGGGLLMLVAVVSLLLLRNRSVEIEENEEDIVETKVMQGPSATITPTAEEPAATVTGPPATVTRGPPLPDTGLPEGWTMAQWEHYGQQWLNQHKQSQD